MRLWAFECGALCHCFLLAPTETKADLAGQLGAVGIDSTSLVVEDLTGHTLVSTAGVSEARLMWNGLLAHVYQQKSR